jgi:hypothetical protein
MALRDQPYLPLYIQDYLTDEKLNECSAASQGIYVKIMCLMHKSKEYGAISLKQNDKQSGRQNNKPMLNFACKLVKHLPFSKDEIFDALEELFENDVIQLNGDKIEQKRMIRDNYLSIIRAKAGKKGGKKTQFDNVSAKAKKKASTENEYENENENENEIPKIKIEIIDFVEMAIEKISEYAGNLAPKKTDSLILNSADTVDKLIRLDGFTLEYITAVLEFGMNDDFWKGNIYSLAALRKKSKNDLTKFQNIANAYERKNKNSNKQAVQDFLND